MPITYDAVNNIITVTGYTAGTPCTLLDIWNADKAGTFILHTRTGIGATDGAPVAVTNALRPADYVMLGGTCNDLYIVVTNWTNMTTATIAIVGTDRCGNAVTESIVVTGNGTYNFVNWYATVTSTQVTVFTKTDAGSFDYEVTQGQWGVVSKQGDNQFLFETITVRIGDGAIETWFTDTAKQIVFADGITTANYQSRFYTHNNAHTTFGNLVSVPNKSTNNGCHIINDENTYYGTTFGCNTTGEFNFYGSTLVSAKKIDRIGFQNGNIYNCYFLGRNFGISVTPVNMDIFNAYLIYGFEGWRAPRNCTFDTIWAFNSGRCLYLLTYANTTIKNLFMRNGGAIFADTRFQSYIINGDLDSWTFSWYLTLAQGKCHRQYEFNRKILNEDGSAYSGKSWTLKDKDGNTVASGTTQADGKLSATDIIVEHGYFNYANGSVEQLYSPFDLWVDGEAGCLDLNLYKCPMDTKDIEGTETMVSVAALVALLTTIQADLDNPNQYKADVSALALEATLGTHDTDIKALLTTVQADLDNPNQYKADVTALALEATLGTHDTDIKNLLSTIQTDLDSPNQYKADVSALALEATLTAMKGAGWTTETLKVIKDAIDALNDLSAANVWAYATRTLTDKAGFSLSAAGIQAIWDILTTNLTTVGSIGELTVLAGKILKNRWRIVGNQLVVYDNDGSTVILRFNLFDNAGVASEINVYERNPV